MFETIQGGSIATSSVNSSITGTHYDIILVDDPNSPFSIYSKASREEAL